MSDALPELAPDALRRYSRQILLDEIGLDGQRKLAAARVLIIGAGGLGSPAALYLAAAGVGTIGIADHDQVELHNLQRQLLHRDASVGQPKVESAAQTLHEINPNITIVTHPEGVTPENAVALFSTYDIVLDGTDNFSVRYLNNDAAYFAERPLVHGSVFKFEGQVAVFDPASGGPCYRCLFPEPPEPGSVPGCGEAGVIGALCGIIGSMQAMEVVKFITDCGPTLNGKLLTYNALTNRSEILPLLPDPACPLCGTNPQITTIDAARYRYSCAATPISAMNQDDYPIELSVTDAHQLAGSSNGDVIIIDVREPHELAICRVEIAVHIPMRQIPERVAELPRNKHLLIMCHHGGRSRRVTDYLRAQGFDAVSNIDGGINAWAEVIDPSLQQY